ncbi:heterokaryon incompatibility protein-domain-containing protein [Xylaria venustula]|nr:heterokaryon incompatibility protein-domain-containing protein [Xylaria venustula]
MARYSKIRDEIDSSDESEKTVSDICDDQLRLNILRANDARKRRQWAVLGTLWIISIVLTAVITAFITWKIQASNTLGTFASGYSSDFGPARTAASVYQRKFTGSPRFDEEKGEYIPPESPSLKYIGSGPKVDSAWDELTKGKCYKTTDFINDSNYKIDRYFLLTDEEAKEAWGDGYTEFWDDNSGGYLGGLDMFHTLHCLDHLRKSFYPDEYILDGIHGDMHQLELAKAEFKSRSVPEQAFYHHEDSMLEEVRNLMATNIKIFIDSEHLWSGESLDKVRVLDTLRIHVGLVSPERTFDVDCVALIMFTSTTSECTVDGFRIGRVQTEPDLESEANFDLARRWLNACENNHTACLKNYTPNLPTRVIDVGGENRGQSLRLVTTHGQSGSYAALSHCWGGQVYPLLLIDNIDRFEFAIEIQDLPLTFQDVIRITRELNIPYLWINSPCIIQNSKADWEQESRQMDLYYGNSIVTIYTSSAESSTSGIFQRHTPPPLTGPSPVYLNLFSGTEENQQIKVQVMDFDDEHLGLLDSNGPLASRGWTLQESMLAPRHLYFGKRQIYWECLQEGQSADGIGLPAGPRTPEFTYPSLIPVLFTNTVTHPAKVAGATEEILLD